MACQTVSIRLELIKIGLQNETNSLYLPGIDSVTISIAENMHSFSEFSRLRKLCASRSRGQQTATVASEWQQRQHSRLPLWLHVDWFAFVDWTIFAQSAKEILRHNRYSLRKIRNACDYRYHGNRLLWHHSIVWIFRASVPIGHTDDVKISLTYQSNRMISM